MERSSSSTFPLRHPKEKDVSPLNEELGVAPRQKQLLIKEKESTY